MRPLEKIRGRLPAAALLLATLAVSGCGTGSAGGRMLDSWGAFFNDIGQQGDADSRTRSMGAPAVGSQTGADSFQQTNGQATGGAQ